MTGKKLMKRLFNDSNFDFTTLNDKNLCKLSKAIYKKFQKTSQDKKFDLWYLDSVIDGELIKRKLI